MHLEPLFIWFWGDACGVWLNDDVVVVLFPYT